MVSRAPSASLRRVWWGGVGVLAGLVALTALLLFTGQEAFAPQFVVRVLALGAVGTAAVRGAAALRPVFARLLLAMLALTGAETVFVLSDPLRDGVAPSMSGPVAVSFALGLLLYPLVVWALRPLRGGRLPLTTRLNVLASTLTLLLPVSAFMAQHTGAGGTWWWINLIIPALDVWVLNVVLTLTLQRRGVVRGVGLLAAGLLCFVTADVAFVTLSSAGRYSTSHPVTVFWTLGLGLFGLAGLHALTADAARVMQPRVAARVRSVATAGPYAALLVAVLTWEWVSRRVVAQDLTVAGIVLLTVTLLVGQDLLARRQRRLTARLRETGRALQRSRAQLLAQLHRDDLTGLPNRRALMDTLDGWAGSGQPLGVLFIDLDGFKAVNDGYGHAAGDDVLRAVGERLLPLARPGAGTLPARLGGDEFALAYVGNAARGAALRSTVEALIGQPITLRGGLLPGAEVTVGGSVGSMHSGDLPEPDRTGPSVASALLSGADHAMYRVKRRSRGTSLGA